MSADHTLIVGARYSSWDDAIKTFRKVREIASKHSYQVGLCGSTLTRDKAVDIDLIVVAAEGAKKSAVEIANQILHRCAKTIYSFEVLPDDDHAGGFVAFTAVQYDRTMLDCYVVGHPDREG